jgi:DNA polymerase-1
MKAVWDLKSQFEEHKTEEVFDCLIAEFLLSEGRYSPTEMMAFEKHNVSTFDALAEKQQLALAEHPTLLKLFTEVEMPLVPVLYQMEKNGIILDTEKLTQLGEKILAAAQEMEKTITTEIGYEMNLNSSQQVGVFLVEKIGVPLGRTTTGRYATNETELQKFADEFPIIEKILLYRELKKLHSTYVESLISKVDAENKIHTTYHQTAVSTGRLASSNPNLQNIPVSSAYGLQIKSCFVASEGHTLLSFDYSQQELRILAHLTGEEKLISAFNENRDVHKTTASQLFSIKYEDVTKEQRQIGKTINFGIIYGMSEGLNISVDVAQKFINTFYETYPKIRSYYDRYLAEGKVNDFVETIFGRRRYVLQYPMQKFIDNGTRRVLMNYPIQGSAADLMKLAMVQVKKQILDKHPEISLLLQIHDDLVFEVPDDDSTIQKFVPLIKDLMCTVYPLAVPVEVDVKIGKRWGELELQKILQLDK